MVQKVTVVMAVVMIFFIFPQSVLAGESIESQIKQHKEYIRLNADEEANCNRLMDAGICQVWNKGKVLKIEYTASREEINRYYKTLEYIKRNTKNLDDLEKVNYVNGFMQKYIQYGTQETAVKTLSHREGICSGYAMAYHQIALEIGLEDRVVYNETHEWNETKVNGKWYGVDTCWGEVTDRPDSWDKHKKIIINENLE